MFAIPRKGPPGRDGLSMVEVLVVVAIIGILMALLLPAVQAARESGRRTECKHNLKQLGEAMQNHASELDRYPSNGWGHGWVGLPDRGTGKNQPGGWIYNLLDHLDQSALRDSCRDLGPQDQEQALTRLIQTPLPVMTCPTRGAPAMSPAAPWGPYFNAQWVPALPKNDYAVNGGDYYTESSIWQGPATLQQGDAGDYSWTDLRLFTGISCQRSEIKPAMVSDGLSQTYMIGEKYVSRPNYNTFDDEGYNQSMYIGTCLDLVRWVQQPPLRDADDVEFQRFGSAHAGASHFVFCDGAVKMINYQIDPEVHRRLGNRHDGLTVDASQY
jgi:prepilin-type N-terminal cleavage/methylation domain-containing protein